MKKIIISQPLENKTPQEIIETEKGFFVIMEFDE